MNFLTILFFSLTFAKKIPEFSLEPPLLESGINNIDWNFGGDAFFKVDYYVRLTSNVKSQFGWLWSRKQMTPEIAKNWNMTVEFQVGKQAGLAGDGFAFWLTRDKQIEGKAFGSAEKFVGLGCFFDTYQNIRHSVRVFH